VKPDPVEREYKGIIIAIDEKAERAATGSGVVVQIGPACWPDQEPWCKVGDHIIFARHSGKFHKDVDTGEDYVMINDEDVQIVIIEED